MNELLQKAMDNHRAGQLSQAEALYRQILQANPNHPDALHLLGVIAYQHGRHQIAIDLIKQAIQINCSNADYPRDIGLAYQVLLRFNEAIKSYRHALVVNPLQADVLSNLGLASCQQGKLDDAVIYYQRTIAVQPLAPVHTILARILVTQGKPYDALSYCQQAIAVQPDYGEAYIDLGNVLNMLGQLEEALACFEQTLAIQPLHAGAYFNIGGVFYTQSKLEQAVRFYHQALVINPGYAEANHALAGVLAGQGGFHDAAQMLQRTLVLRPNYSYVFITLLYTLLYQASSTPEEIFEAHLRYAKQFESPLKSSWPVHVNDSTPDRRLKIGYVSPDFRTHSVAEFLEPILCHHDKSQVEVYGYYHHAQRDAVTERIQSYTDHWIPCQGWSDDALAHRILEDRIDILVDLAGHTADNRLLTFARKAAPVQVTYLGYISTTGLDAIDYRITTLDADPFGNDAYHSESLYRLPQTLWCYRPPMDAPDVSLPTPAATQGYLTFASMNNIAKVSPEALALWADILNALPHARLIMTHVPQGSAVLALYERFAAHGIAPERLTFHGKLPLAQFRQLPRHIDVVLDPFPHNGLTTTCTALWMGLPVISLQGQAFVSRFGLVLLKALKLEELVAHSPQDYVRIAKDLASDLPRLTALRVSLRTRFNASPLRDEPALTRDIELAYRSMWRAWCLTRTHQA